MMQQFPRDGNRIKTALFLSGGKGRSVRTRLFPMDETWVKATLFLSGGQGDAVMMQQFPRDGSKKKTTLSLHPHLGHSSSTLSVVWSVM
jgi:hypothetical protein